MTVTAQMTQNQKSYKQLKPEKEFQVMEEMYAALCACVQKGRHFEAKTTKPIVEWGEELHLQECTRPELIRP